MNVELIQKRKKPSFISDLFAVYGESVGPMGSRLLNAMMTAYQRQAEWASRMENQPLGEVARQSVADSNRLAEQAMEEYDPNSPTNTEKAMQEYNKLKGGSSV